eukprot:scaffold248418_cov111-Cyclotella_meneghiniana.AAC.6
MQNIVNSPSMLALLLDALWVSSTWAMQWGACISKPQSTHLTKIHFHTLVGDSVGSEDGKYVGVSVGTFVGSLVDGDLLGLRVKGDNTGELVGLLVIRELGVIVGLQEGPQDGATVGTFVVSLVKGDKDGDLLGLRVMGDNTGALVGLSVIGLQVGPQVGAMVGETEGMVVGPRVIGAALG